MAIKCAIRVVNAKKECTVCKATANVKLANCLLKEDSAYRRNINYLVNHVPRTIFVCITLVSKLEQFLIMNIYKPLAFDRLIDTYSFMLL